MSARFTRTIVSLLLVLISYSLYALIAVPWIEPVARERKSAIQPAEQPQGSAQSPAARFRPLLEPLFAADSWELSDAKILKNRQFMLLLQDYETLEGGRQLRMQPCTIVFNPHVAAEKGDESRPPRSLILQAPEGAILDFDQPLDLTRGGLGRLVAGRLVGEVTIWSRPSEDDAADSIQVITRNVQITSQQIWTSHDVSFRYGRNSGSGRDLMINLDEAESSDIQRLPNETSTRLRSLELVHLDELILAVVGSSVLDPSHQQSTAGQPAAPVSLQVRCEGPLLFDFVGGSATLKKKVSIQSVGGAGQPDRLTCELLALQFRAQNKRQSETTATTKGVTADESWDVPAFELSQIAALGKANLDAPSHSLRAQAERLELHLSHNLVLLQDSQQAVLSYGIHTFRGPRMLYHFDRNGGPGRAEIDGAGEYQGKLREDAVHVSWQNGLDFGPREGSYLLEVDGKARIRWAKNHQLAANKLQVWLRATASQANTQMQLPPLSYWTDSQVVPGAQPTQHPSNHLAVPSNHVVALIKDWQPDRVVARKDVRLQTPQLIGQTEFADVRFEEGDVPHATAAEGPALVRPLGAASENSNAKKPTRRFGLRGREMHIVLRRSGQPTPGLQSVTVKGGVHLRELTTDESALQTEIRGDLMELDQQNGVDGSALVHVAGEPAMVRTGGMEVSGRNIRLDQARNRIWIDGAGAAYIRLSERIAAQFSRRQATAQIAWQGAMNFDGQSVTCRQAVEIRGPAQIATADSLRATLAEPIRLQTAAKGSVRNATPKSANGFVLAEITLAGHVWLENRTFDDDGLASIDELSLESLTYRQQTGELFGAGPGWMSSVRFTRGAQLGESQRNRPPSLSHTLIEFQQQMQGSLRVREISVFDQVRAIHGPVKDWQERLRFDEPSGLSPDSVFMRCARLTVAQMGPTRRGGEQPLEFVASGNTEIQGRTFDAQAQRVRYAQANGLLVMEGDGRSAARLSIQNRIGGPHQKAAARKIQYWIRENRASAEGVVFGDFDLRR